jgi:hypothetical protein
MNIVLSLKILEKPDLSVRFHLDRIVRTEEGDEPTDPEVLKQYLTEPLFEKWYRKREQWAEKEIPVRQP